MSERRRLTGLDLEMQRDQGENETLIFKIMNKVGQLRPKS